MVVVQVRADGEDAGDLEVPKGFVRPSESPEDCLTRVMEADTGWGADDVTQQVVFEGYTYDPRQTDHAWVESRAYLMFDDQDSFPGSFEPGGEFDEVKWWPFEAETVNRVPSGLARFIREAVKVLEESGRMESTTAEFLLARTG